MSRKLLTILVTAGALAVPAAGYAQIAPGDPPGRDRATAPQGRGMPSATEKDSPGFVDDAVITTRVKVGFAKDDGVRATRIRVNTDKGVVRLSGVAGSREESEKAESIAKSIEGVISVRNELTIEAK